MKTLTLKVPASLLTWLKQEARRAKRPKSTFARELLQQQVDQKKNPLVLDLASDLRGCVDSGLKDLSYNKKHLKGFGT
ncbi:MAG: hypothetical protein JWM99_4138 [Verrucomicrobiales bacterium]|nr:hypothetical protein [Verrucomicrobiales bacterium]